ncbi:hsp90 co-chaperone, putative [Perkinsus marinus ATCC 50983]|uniref:Hsp90 co-chaperone, putative n=1 Tax=Perkinsus marinus (strain ATCC 50983 / TXsc) TaxID=423536 RepID=C5K6P6_PERM5|nr:hsp90 co-chaperone, putative [Perkinsus marinus ATCC 50983]EER19966.1 hsp90 co-chaperone, putative [Perkinsus marinus ATCC 50983]|eukprot:XP_002788170.1 hsp90 co-chaperone, putative [Perkinsus marinus ATCC 50983]
MSAPTTLRPNLKWAQRDEHIWLTVDLSGVEDMKVDLQPTTLKFSGASHGDKYAFDITFYAEIVPEESKMRKCQGSPLNWSSSEKGY